MARRRSSIDTRVRHVRLRARGAAGARRQRDLHLLARGAAAVAARGRVRRITRGQRHLPHQHPDLPQPGFNRGYEIDDSVRAPAPGSPGARRPPTAPRSSWIDFETTVSTAGDQVAIAPGTLEREWEEGGRRYFHYRSGAPMVNWFAFASARYAVKQGDARRRGDRGLLPSRALGERRPHDRGDRDVARPLRRGVRALSPSGDSHRRGALHLADGRRGGLSRDHLLCRGPWLPHRCARQHPPRHRHPARRTRGGAPVVGHAALAGAGPRRHDAGGVVREVRRAARAGGDPRRGDGRGADGVRPGSLPLRSHRRRGVRGAAHPGQPTSRGSTTARVAWS